MPLNVLKESPLDSNSAWHQAPPPAAAVRKWVPSRYTVRATTGEGDLLLWNSLSGSMNLFRGSQGEEVREALRKPGLAAPSEGLVKYLVERGYLIEENANEFRQVQLAFGQKQYRSDTLELILLTSEDCNFRCTYCYEDFARGTMLPQVREGVKNLLRKRIQGLKHFRVSYFGGEPLYGFSAIEDLAPFFVEMSRQHGVAFSSAITTNGYLLTPETAEKLLAWGVNYFQITVDGAPQDHDCSRPARDGSGTFSTILANLQALKARPEPYRVDVRVNFDRRNHLHMTEFLDIVERDFRGDPRFQLKFRGVGKWGGANDENLDICGRDEMYEVKKRLEDEAGRRGLKTSDGLNEINYSGSEVCYAARPYNFIIGASGKLMKCTVVLDRDDYNVVGSIDPEGELTLHQDRMALWTEPAFQGDTKCQKCVVLPLCHGMHCPLVRMEENRSPCTPTRLDAKESCCRRTRSGSGTAPARNGAPDPLNLLLPGIAGRRQQGPDGSRKDRNMADNDKYNTPTESTKDTKKPKVQNDELETDELEDASGGGNGNCNCGQQ